MSCLVFACLVFVVPRVCDGTKKTFWLMIKLINSVWFQVCFIDSCSATLQNKCENTCHKRLLTKRNMEDKKWNRMLGITFFLQFCPDFVAKHYNFWWLFVDPSLFFTQVSTTFPICIAPPPIPPSLFCVLGYQEV